MSPHEKLLRLARLSSRSATRTGGLQCKCLERSRRFDLNEACATFSERERFRLSRHKEILPRTLVFIRHQMALFRASVPQEAVFSS